MAITDDLGAEVTKILKEPWSTREGIRVPDTPDLKLANDALELTGTVLYADLADSTGLVDQHTPGFAAEVYKAYLICACRLIRANTGEITAFDGDRVMAVFLGSSKNTNAMRTALQINHAVVRIINPRLKVQYPKTTFEVQHAVGIDTGKLFVARAGIRGSNDLVWVGNPANVAAKLCGLRSGNYSSWVTSAVYDTARGDVKLSKDTKMWEARKWISRGDASIYRSNWTLTP